MYIDSGFVAGQLATVIVCGMKKGSLDKAVTELLSFVENVQVQKRITSLNTKGVQVFAKSRSVSIFVRRLYSLTLTGGKFDVQLVEDYIQRTLR